MARAAYRYTLWRDKPGFGVVPLGKLLMRSLPCTVSTAYVHRSNWKQGTWCARRKTRHCLPCLPNRCPPPTALTLPKRRLRRWWDWLGKYSNTFILLIAILALIRVLPADSQAAASVWRQIHPVALSDQAKVALAETWASTYLNDGQGASSKTWLADLPSDITPAISASADLLTIGLKPGSGGGYSFVLDTAQNANLPTGNWFLSMESAGPRDCEY